jgi:hypothetical protein
VEFSDDQNSDIPDSPPPHCHRTVVKRMGPLIRSVRALPFLLLDIAMLQNLRNIPTIQTISNVFNLIGSILSVAAVALAAIEYFFHIAIFYNPTSTYMTAYAEDVVPLLVQGGTFVADHKSELDTNDPELFATLIKEFVKARQLQGQLSVAVGVLEDIINCHQSYICRIDGYSRLEPSFRSLWYTYRPVLAEMRGTDEKADFGVQLQAEAKRVLERDRKEGNTP